MHATVVDHSTSSATLLQDNVSAKAAFAVSTVTCAAVGIMDFLIAELVSATLLELSLFQTGHLVTAPYPMRFVLCLISV